MAGSRPERDGTPFAASSAWLLRLRLPACATFVALEILLHLTSLDVPPWVEVAVDLVPTVLLAATTLVIVGQRVGLQGVIDTRTAELAASEEHYRLLAEYSSDVVVRHDSSGTMVWVSPSVRDVLGWDPAALVGRHPRTLVHPEDLAVVGAEHRRLYAGQRRIVFEARLQTADGGWRWLQSSMTLFGDAGGADGDGVSVWRDVEAQVSAREALVRSEEELRLSEQRMRSSVEALPIGFGRYTAVRDAAGGVVDLRLEYANTAGRGGPDGPGQVTMVPGASMLTYFPGARQSRLWWAMVEALDSDEAITERVEVPDHPWTGVYDIVVARTDDHTVVNIWTDVTAQVAGEALLGDAYRQAADAKLMLSMALDAIAEPFLVWHVGDAGPASTRLVMANPATTAVLGMTPEQVIGSALTDLYPGALAHSTHELLARALAERTPLQAPDQAQSGLPAVPGVPRSVWRPLVSPMDAERAVVLMRDVTREVEQAIQVTIERDEAARSARRDPMTGLVNRRGLDEALGEAVGDPRLGPDCRVAVVFADVDGLKEVNDARGHEAGDQLLLQVGRRLSSLVRATDTVARYGGDEFVVVLRDLGADWDASAFLDRAETVLGRPLTLSDGGVLHPAASLGIAVSPPLLADQDLLMTVADSAMYRSKHERRQRRLDRSTP